MSIASEENVVAARPARKLRIIHVEDEPALNSGFARELGPLLDDALSRLDFALVYIKEDTDDESDLRLTLVYEERGGNEQMQLIYEFAENEADFRKFRDEYRDAEVVLVVFDVFVGNPTAGIAFYHEIEDEWVRAQRIFYTAYPGTVVRFLGWDRNDPRLFEKPFHGTKVLEMMVGCVLKWLTGTSK